MSDTIVPRTNIKQPLHISIIVMMAVMLSATSSVKTGRCVFEIGLFQQKIPLLWKSLTTMQLLFLRRNKEGLCNLSLGKAQVPQANTRHSWRILFIFRIYTKCLCVLLVLLVLLVLCGSGGSWNYTLNFLIFNKCSITKCVAKIYSFKSCWHMLF